MKPVLKPLDQQVLVITGATSGIGLTTARRAAKRGAAVFLVARNGAELSRLCAEIEAEGGRAGHAVADVGVQAEVEAAAAAAIDRFGGFDAWINIAGVAVYSPLLETPRSEHERMFQTNYWGVVNSCTAAVPHLKTRGGALIVVASVAAEIGTPLLGAYAASKHAVKGFVDSLRIDLLAERAPISVTLVKPSGIGTPLAEHAANHQSHAAKVPPPAYSPEAVADAILYAAEHPRRDVIVGGVGALQILAANLVPAFADAVSAHVGPLLSDRRRPPSIRNNLFAAGPGGAERSRHELILPGSLYTAASLHRAVAAGAALLVLGGLAVARGRARRSRRQA